MDLGFGVSDIVKLAAKVSAAYRDAPDSYRHISEEVEALQGLIIGARQRLKSISSSSDEFRAGQKVLISCHSLLADLNSIVKKYNILASPSSSRAIQRIMLSTEDIPSLRARITSNVSLLNGFLIQRFDIPTLSI